MKINTSIFLAIVGVAALTSCGRDKRSTGKVYMPDMAISRAYETYAPLDSNKFTTDANAWHSAEGDVKIFYNSLPVSGTVSRSNDTKYNYPLSFDKVGDTANYYASRFVKNPIASLTKEELEETERKYLVKCGICHGAKLDGNGPLWKDGDGPYPAAPKNLITLDMADGTMFHSMTYGRNLMGSYASQLTPKQRWEIIYYIRVKQGKINQDAPAPTEPVADTTATVAAVAAH